MPDEKAPEPIVALDPKGTPAILSYNIPEPTSYTGRTYTELKFEGTPQALFQPVAFEFTPAPQPTPPPPPTPQPTPPTPPTPHSPSIGRG